MSTKILFDNLVAVVTGSGNGIGRIYAMEFARRGAAVVVNDLGVGTDGSGSSSKAADLVVSEIKAFGGKAVANYDSVEHGEKIISTALENFGKIDILINNAGILRDRSFSRMSEEDWNLVQRVHLYGSYSCTKAAWNHMRKQNFGRVVFIASSSGIYGNVGQANYAAAKLGCHGLSQTLAQEGERFGISVNTVAPVAGSRMTETVMSPEMVEALRPEYISPLVLWLCHPDCQESGSLFEVGGGWFSKLRWQRSDGTVLLSPQASNDVQFPTVEEVKDNWQNICDFTKSTNPNSARDTTIHMLQILAKNQEEIASSPSRHGDSESNKSIANLAGIEIDPYSQCITVKDALLFAVSTGVRVDSHHGLRYLYENHSNFQILPNYGIILGQIPTLNLIWKIVDRLPEGVSPANFLHGEHYFKCHKQLQTNQKTITKGQIDEVLDKRNGASLIMNSSTYDEESGDLICENQFVSFVVGAGNFGGPRKGTKEIATELTPKDRKPDWQHEETIERNQAAIYRLNGDFNPLHIDPEFAQIGGFSTPILHGLCTLNYSIRHVIQECADSDFSKLSAVKVRFSSPVLPGERIATDIWKGESNTKDVLKVHFQCRNVSSKNSICLSGGWIELHCDAKMNAKL